MSYANIRELLGGLVGARVADVTQHDKEDWDRDRSSFVQFTFDDGRWIRFPVSDAGFHTGDCDGEIAWDEPEAAEQVDEE